MLADMATPLTPYHKRLFVFLSVATFFEGYDFFALTQLLPEIRADFGLSEFQGGLLYGFVNVGTVLAFLLVRRADDWGRRRVLMITIIGYTLCTLATGLAWDAWSFATFQLLARLFLIGEWAISMVIAAEEYPADRRGMVIGVLQAFASLGAIVCAGVVPMLLKTPFGWRSVYFVGIIPLLILAYARRGLRETRRFEEQVVERTPVRPSIWRIWSTPHRRRTVQLGVIWLFTFACSNTAISFWKEFAVADRGFSDDDVSFCLTTAAAVSMPLVFYAGKLLDLIGRRKGAAVIFVSTSAGVFLAYTLHDKWALTAVLTVAIFGVSAVLPVLNAFTSELFPTDLRGDAFAWANNLIGRVGYVLAPVGVGALAELWGGWGPAVQPVAVFPLLALGLILWWLPETNQLELEETSSLGTEAG